MRAKRWMFRLGLVVGAVIFVTILLEVGLRLATGDRYQYVYPILENGSSAYLPGQEARFKHLEWDYTIRINSYGFRDVEPSGDTSAPGVVFLGDSFTEGYGVAEEDAFVTLVREELGGTRVFNAGHSGTHLKHYLRTYREHFKDQSGIRLVVLAMLVDNDFVTTDTPDDLPVVTDAERRSFHYRLMLLKTWLAAHVRIYSFAAERAKRHPLIVRLLDELELINAEPSLLDSPIYRKDQAAAILGHSRDLLVQFRQELAREGRELLVVLIPRLELVDPSTWKILADRLGSPEAAKAYDPRVAFDFMIEGFREGSVPFLDLAPGFTEAIRKDPGPYYFRWDPHWNARGHRVAADLITGVVRATVSGPPRPP